MNVGDQVKHRLRDDVGIGEIFDIDLDGTCSVKFVDCTFSGIPIDVLISAKEEAKQAQQVVDKESVLKLLLEYDYKEADKLYFDQCSDWWAASDYAAEVRLAKIRQAQQAAQKEADRLLILQEGLKQKILTILDQGDFESADQFYEAECSSWWKRSKYDQLKSETIFTHNFVEIYYRDSLSELDSLYRTSQSSIPLTVEDFVEIKRPLVRKVLDSLGIHLDMEQESACSRPEYRLLVKARAGSGKTRTLCARAALAIYDEKLDPNQVMILAFNKAAATEVKQRIQSMAEITGYENARTFHSLAHQLVKPHKKLLFDNGGEVSAKEQSRFMQRMMHRIMNPVFKESMVEFFRKELEHVNSIGRDLPPEEYLVFRRALEHVTLKGDRVKSNGEKIIGDFLFEHGIEYRYEKAWDWKTDYLDGGTYRPDFTILANGNDFILEHWALDPEDARAKLPDEWDIIAEQYKKQIIAKRKFWESKSMPLLETSAAMMHGGRSSFESKIKATLQASGILCNLLSKEEIVSKVFNNDFNISRLSELFLQFMQRSKKRGWSPDEVAEIISRNPDKEPRSRLFHQLALRAYREYEAMLEEENAMDFDDLLKQACEEVESRGGDVSIHLGQGDMISIRNLKWIMLDEYQDFSELYFRMLRAILKCIPEARLIAVGDDWQAINAFAGAELRFYENFADYFSGGESIGVTTNYRSDRAVVGAGNQLMVGRGEAAKISRNAVGIIRKKYLEDFWIEFRPGDQFTEEREADSIYLPQRTEGKNPSEPDLRQAQALKACTQIILQDPTKKIMLLARTGRIYGLESKVFRERLIVALTTFDGMDIKILQQNISIMTAHGSKGRESSRVIILDVTKRQFPKIHPDNLLFELFGVTSHTVLEDERRLFYVALTRAENELYLLTEKGSESHYLDEIARLGTPDSYQKNTPVNLGDFAQRVHHKILEFGAK